MIHALDSTGINEMRPLFYQYACNQAKMSLVDLLKILGRDPDAWPRHLL